MDNEDLNVHRERKLKDLLDRASSRTDRLCMELAYEIGFTEALETALKMVQKSNDNE